MAKLPNFLVIIRSEKLSGKGQGRGVGVRKKERFVLGKRTFRSQKSKHFVLRIIPIIELDKDLEIKANIGNVPDEHHRSTDLSSYSGSTSVYDNKFVFVMASLGYIACYEKLVDGAIQLLWDFYLEEPKYVKKQLDRKNLKLGFSDVKMTKNYIFCSYFGQKYVRENRRNIKVHNILVFDHNGHFLANLHTDRSASRLSVSDDEKTIYAVTEEPEIAIVRFDISNILK